MLHSGDWKIDRTPVHRPDHVDEKRLREIGEEGVDALVCDSTNVLREGFSPSEADVAATLDASCEQPRAAWRITTFASHVERISSAVTAAAPGRPRGRDRRPRHAQHDRGGARLRLSARCRALSSTRRPSAICRPTR